MLSSEKILATSTLTGLRFPLKTHNSALGAQLIALFKSADCADAPSLLAGPRGGLSAHI